MHQRAFRDREAESVRREQRVTHANLGVAVFPVKKLEKKSGVVRPRGRQAILFDKGDLLLELGAQLLLAKGGVAANLKVGLLRDPFLLFRLALSLLLLSLLLGELDRALAEREIARQAKKERKTSEALHQRNRIRYLTKPRNPPCTPRSPIRTKLSFTL